VLNLAQVAQVSVGSSHTCALLADSTIKCWGGQGVWQLGAGEATANGREPVVVTGINSAVSLSAGYYATCAVLSSGELRCWGWNQQGVLGNDGYPDGSAVPVKVLDGVSSVSQGLYHACAVLRSGGVMCWGNNEHGELGNDDIADSTTPSPVLNLAQVAQVSVGSSHTCALKKNGEVWCWGDNSAKQLGGGSTDTKSRVPVRVQGL
jgi:alpha-tubulin suppressor-like RCC1 family protein